MLSPNDLLTESYRIVRFIGEGGTGEVYLAENLASDEKVAIKVLKPAFSRDKAFIDLMKRELLRNVSDDAVVGYYELLKTSAHGGLHFLVMEYIEGPLLSDLMRDGPVDPKVLMAIGARAAQGLNSAHRAQIYHRDVSPDNIILRGGDPNRATLIDFGIAKDLRTAARTVVGDGFAGKYEYAAPEQLDGNADARSDIYSLGATLLAAARGKAPTLPASLLEIHKAKLIPLEVGEVSDPLAGLISRMSAPDPADRIQTAAALLRAFEAPESDALPAPEEFFDLDAPAKPVRPKVARSGGRGRGWIWGGLAVVLIAALGLAFQQGWIEDLTKPRLPLADPYRFTAEFGTPATVTGNAPSEEARAALLAAITEVSGAPPTAALRLADGVPSEAWPEAVAGAIRAAEPLDQIRVDVLNERLIVRGLASSTAVRDGVVADLRAAAALAALDLDTNIRVLVQPLAMATLLSALDQHSDCGQLAPAASVGAGGAIAPDQAITIEGQAASDDTTTALRETLDALVEGRDLSLNIQIVNPFVCRVLTQLAPKEGGNVRIAYSIGGTGEVNNTNDFRPTDTPIIDVVAPIAEDGFLSVFLADNEGAVLHLLPYQGREGHRLANIGTLTGGQRFIRVAYPLNDPTCERCALDLSYEPYGTYYVFAVLTEKPLFDDLRFRQENIDDFAPDLARAIATAERRGTLRAVAMRPINVKTR